MGIDSYEIRHECLLSGEHMLHVYMQSACKQFKWEVYGKSKK